jgi:hypothetical protein
MSERVHLDPGTGYAIQQGSLSPNPYRGTAPEPRSAANAGVTVQTGSGSYEVDVNGLPGSYASAPPNGGSLTQAPPVSYAPIGDPNLQVSQPPAQPDVAQENAELKAQNAELRAAIGKQNRATELSMAEMNLRLNALAAGREMASPAILPPLPLGINAGDPVPWQDFIGVMSQFTTRVHADATAQAIRSTWDVTQAEEMAVLQRHGATIPAVEPARTTFIRDAVALLRRSAEPEPTASPAPGSVPNQAPRVIRPLAQTVPLVEVSQAAQVAEPRQTNALETAQREYVAAEAEVNGARSETARKVALGKMRAAYDRILALQNVTEDTQRQQAFIQGRG